MIKVGKFLSAVNRVRKNKFPSRWVTRKKFNELQGQYENLLGAISNPSSFVLRGCRLKEIKSLPKSRSKEVCLFLSYSPEPRVKPHVIHHVESFLRQGVEVVLIVNTDNFDVDFEMPPDFCSRLSGVFVRENIGYDFSGWAQVFSKFDILPERMFLVNDSIVGPLDEDLFDGMMEKIRASDADFVGLTSNPEPRFHLQSYFLVLGGGLLADKEFCEYFRNLLPLPTKELVIAAYETKMTAIVQFFGHKAAAMFDLKKSWLDKGNSTSHGIKQLYASGFPYLKVSALKKEESKNLLNELGLLRAEFLRELISNA